MNELNESQKAKEHYFELIKHLTKRLISKEYKIEQVTEKVVSLKIDRLFWFNIWVGNTWKQLDLNGTFEGSNISFFFNDDDKRTLWLDLKELTTEYRKQKLETELKKINENATI